jgi:hypothetical protein
MAAVCSRKVSSQYMDEYDRHRNTIRGRKLLRRRTHFPLQTDEIVSAKYNLIQIIFAALKYFVQLSLNHKYLLKLSLLD